MISTVHLYDAVDMKVEVIVLFQNILFWFCSLCCVEPQNDSMLVAWLSQGSHILSVIWVSQAHLPWPSLLNPLPPVTAMNNRTLFSVFGWNRRCHQIQGTGLEKIQAFNRHLNSPTNTHPNFGKRTKSTEGKSW